MQGRAARTPAIVVPPALGWRFVDAVDVDDLDGTCEGCGRPIRFVYFVEHAEHPERLEACRGCAVRLCGDEPEELRDAEGFLLSEPQQRLSWMRRRWGRTRRRQNLFILTDESIMVVVFPHRRGRHVGRWGYALAGRLSGEQFASADDAKLAAFDDYWDMIAT